MSRALLALGIAASAMFVAPAANASCSEPNLDCTILNCGPRIDDQGRIDWVAC